MKKLNLAFIKSQRVKLGITLQTIADLLGFKNASNYLKYENGVYAFKADQLPALAEILECSINELFFVQTFAKTAK